MLSHATAAWWWGLIEERPTEDPREHSRGCRSWPGVSASISGGALERAWHRRMPVTAVAQTLLDYASSASLNRGPQGARKGRVPRVLDLPELRGG